MTAQDINSTERFWVVAISQWLKGDKAPLAAALADKSRAIEGDAIREFLTDLAATGTFPGGKGGRPVKLRPWKERAIVAAVFAQWEALGSQADAIGAVAPDVDMSEDALRGLVEKLRDKEHFTFEDWQDWKARGHDDFKNK